MEKIKTDQISIEFQSDNNNHFSKPKSFMFIEDVGISKYRIKNTYLSTDLACENPEKVINFLSKNILIFHRANQWGGTLNLKESILDIIETISSRLAIKGYCVFEKITSTDGRLTLKIIQGDVIVRNKKVIQIIPKDNTQKLSNKSIIPKSKCFIIEFPNKICSSKQYRKLLTQIGKIDLKNPLHSALNPTKLSSLPGYNTIVHHEKLELYLKRLTRKISWHHRENFSPSDNFSNYYSTLRSLKFIRTKIILLNHISDFVESIVADIFGNSILKIHYLKTLNEIELIIKNYEDGEFTRDLHLQIIQEFSL